MRAQLAAPPRANSRLRNLRNEVLIENGEGDVVLSATRDSFSDNRKLFFIRQLSAECGSGRFGKSKSPRPATQNS
jgi:hypothetical protein